MKETKMSSMGNGGVAYSPLSPSVKNHLLATLFLLPAMVFLLVFIYFPTVLALLLGFFHYQIGGLKTQFVGLQNFHEAFTYPVFWRAVLNTLFFAAMVVPVQLALSMAIALLINKISRVYSFVRTLVLLPYVTPAVGTAIGWMWIFEPNYGLANGVLHWLHLPELNWLQSPYMALPSVAIYSIWHGVGFDVVIIMAALSTLPKSILEAASIDGANHARTLWKITLPLISPTIFFLVVISTIGSLQGFSQMFALSNASGGPEHATTTLLFLVYQTAFNYGDYSYAAAMALVLVIMILLFTLFQRWVSKRMVFYQ